VADKGMSKKEKIIIMIAQCLVNPWVKALMILSNTQNVDGSWGDEDREWNTFLVVHALKNKACL